MFAVQHVASLVFGLRMFLFNSASKLTENLFMYYEFQCPFLNAKERLKGKNNW